MQSRIKIVIFYFLVCGNWLSPVSAQMRNEKKLMHLPLSPAPYCSKGWVADQGNGTYRNAILYTDYSGPDVIRVETVFI